MSLDFHKQIFESCLESDSLVVMSSGLGIHHVILAFLKLYCNSDHLVLFINPNSDALQESYVFYNEKLLQFGINYANLPTYMNQDQATSNKTNLYKKGYIYYGPASTFILDILMGRLQCHLIRGIIVDGAHRVNEMSPERLLLALYRERNPEGFIKAFSTEASLVVGNGGGGMMGTNVHRLLKLLQLKKLSLWPRFRSEVVASLDRNPPDLVELSIPMTENMIEIESSLKKTIEECLSELRYKNKHLVEGHRINFDDGLFNSFDSLVSSWGDINRSSKQTLSIIKILRSLSDLLLKYDCVTFLKFLEAVAAMEKANDIYNDQTSWIYSDVSSKLFSKARERVYTQRAIDISSYQKKQKKDTNSNTANSTTKTKEVYERELVLEENPKWKLVHDILKEIEEENKLLDSSDDASVLIFVKDERTCMQLQQYLKIGGYELLLAKYFRLYPLVVEDDMDGYQQDKKRSFYSNNPMRQYRSRKNQQAQAIRKKTISDTNIKKKMNAHGNDLFTMGVSIIGASNSLFLSNPKIIDINNNNNGDEEGDVYNNNSNIGADSFGDDIIDVSRVDEFYNVLSPPYIIIHPMDSSLNILDEKRPRYIIIYDPDITVARQIELYRASHPNQPLRVYSIIYSGSLEERKYIAIIKREKAAFETLIKEKQTIDRQSFGPWEGESKENITKMQQITPQELGMLDESSITRVDSRRGGGSIGKQLMVRSNTVQKTIVVDSFEFKSSLPVIIYANQYQIVPLRLTTGDYVLTPAIAVERKSISDLIGSFSSGRLYHQIETMSRSYRNPILLIEFDQNQPFNLLTVDDLKLEYISMGALSSKLVLLARSFPKMRIIWARSSHSTVSIFTKLKQDQPEPEPSSINVLAEPADNNHDYNYSAQDVLSKIPGVTNENIHKIMDNITDLYHLSKMTLDQLKLLLESDTESNLIYDFFNSNVNQSNTSTTTTTTSNNNNNKYKGKWYGKGKKSNK